jgi:hypothetical protein
MVGAVGQWNGGMGRDSSLEGLCVVAGCFQPPVERRFTVHASRAREGGA